MGETEAGVSPAVSAVEDTEVLVEKISDKMRVHGATLKSNTMRETFEEFAKFFESLEKPVGEAIGETKFGQKLTLNLRRNNNEKLASRTHRNSLACVPCGREVPKLRTDGAIEGWAVSYESK